MTIRDLIISGEFGLIHKHSMMLYLVVQFFVAGNSQGQDRARASCMTDGFISVLYRSEQTTERVRANLNMQTVTIKQNPEH